MMMNKPKIGISTCLLGEEVRYDGGHKHNRYITRTLGDYFDFVPYCPEVAIGLGTPRPPIRLVDRDGNQRAVGSNDASVDVTDKLERFAERVAASSTDLSGYILKKDSPSCGMERVRVYNEDTGMPEKKGIGIHARIMMDRHPHLPFEEEGRLMDPGLRDNFIERVFACHRWQQLLASGLKPASLVSFHTAHKFLLLSHDESRYRSLGRIVAEAGSGDIDELGERYIAEFMACLNVLSTPRKHANVLMHIMGFFKDQLEAGDKEELLGLIDAHREGLVPVIVPVTLMNHYQRKYPSEYIENQVYLEPHPKELMLRNHI
jgi:uncharacterized protein YbgA (DUF1722 family)/uncharacterized protein YbbK (DUF523 family)